MSKTVVIIDDSKFLLKQLKKFFEEQMDFNVLDVGYDGNDAIEQYEKHKGVRRKTSKMERSGICPRL